MENQIKAIIEKLKTYAEKNDCVFSEKDYADQTLIYFAEAGFIIDVLIDWKNKTCVENVAHDHVDYVWMEYDYKEFIKYFADFPNSERQKSIEEAKKDA